VYAWLVELCRIFGTFGSIIFRELLIDCALYSKRGCLPARFNKLGPSFWKSKLRNEKRVWWQSQFWIYNTFYYRGSISQSELTKQTIKTAAEKLLSSIDQSDWLSQRLTRACHPSPNPFPNASKRQPIEEMESERAGQSNCIYMLPVKYKFVFIKDTC